MNKLAPGDAALPEWDLSDLYDGPASSRLAEDLSDAETRARAFAAAYKDKLAGLDGAGFAAAIREYEAIQEIIGRALSYAQLLQAGNVSDPEIGRFMQDTNETATDITAHTLFFTLEINRLTDADLAAKYADSGAARYRPWLAEVRAMKPYQLSDELETLLHDKEVAGRNAWIRLFDETMAGLRFTVAVDQGTETLTVTEVLDKLSDPRPVVRRAAGKALGAVLGENIRLFALITNTLAKDKQIEDRWRGFARPISARNLANQVEDGVVDALTGAVREAYPDLSHRYYAMKARWLGQDKLDYWDRNAPLPDDTARTYGWEDARDIVLGAYAQFSDDLAAVGRTFFDKPWIDVPPRPGKTSGAFAHPTVPSAHPYLLLNFMGRTRDVMTLAHELGHGVHQVLAGPQGLLMSDTPLTLAETASVFGEMLTFRALLDRETDPVARKIMLAGKVEDMLNTVVRQIAFHEFETLVHDARKKGEVPADGLAEIWLDVQSRSLGPAFRFEDEYRHFWAYIPHFVHSPFYVYAYAFGDCLVNSLYGVYADRPDGFADKYLDLLRAGGSLRHTELLAPFGLDASDPAFWQRGLSVIRGLIDELEAMDG